MSDYGNYSTPRDGTTDRGEYWRKRLDREQAERGALILHRLVPAPDHGAGFRRDPETGFLYYSSEWLGDATPQSDANGPGMIAGRHDTAERKQALRKQREKGCSIYIAAEQLQAAGVDPNGPAPFYRVWAGERGRFIVTLYGAK